MSIISCVFVHLVPHFQKARDRSPHTVPYCTPGCPSYFLRCCFHLYTGASPSWETFRFLPFPCINEPGRFRHSYLQHLPSADT